MSDATLILERASAGDPAASRELFDMVYDNLRALAGSYFRGQPRDLTLEPTALVHEAFLKLVKNPSPAWQSRAHFMAVAATAMRQVLQDRARRRRREKHGGNRQRLTLSGLASPAPQTTVDVVAMDDALSKLAELDERQYRIVELRFFGGLDVNEVATMLQVSKSTVEKEWTRIRAWLSRELSGANA